MRVYGAKRGAISTPRGAPAHRCGAEVEERAQAGQEKVHEWLARAAQAPADRAWRCSACGAQHETWRSVCENCGAFGTLHWRAPGTFGQVLPPEAQEKLALTMNSGG
jgi:HemY protein